MLPTGASVASSSPLLVVDICPYSNQRNTIEESVAASFHCSRAGLASLPMLVLVLLNVAALNSSRISEILKLSAADYLGNNRFLARGLKKSRSYIVSLQVKELRAIRANDSEYRSSVFALGYNAVWRWCVRCGLGGTPRGRKTAARTHLHRYYTAKQVLNASSEITAGEILHHKSRRSISSYIV